MSIRPLQVEIAKLYQEETGNHTSWHGSICFRSSLMSFLHAQVEIAKLYQEAKVNPLAGCLPTLVTLPVWISLYRALSNVADEGLLTEGFFWIPSLAGPTSTAAQKAVRCRGEAPSALLRGSHSRIRRPPSSDGSSPPPPHPP